MSARILKRLPYFLLFLPAVLVLSGCSSNEIFGPEIRVADSDGGVFKITVTTNYDAPQPETNIIFDLPLTGPVFLELTNATGYHIRTLLDDELSAGTYAVPWDGKNDDGEEIEPGIYMFHLVACGVEAWHPFPFGISMDTQRG